MSDNDLIEIEKSHNKFDDISELKGKKEANGFKNEVRIENGDENVIPTTEANTLKSKMVRRLQHDLFCIKCTL